MERWRFKQLLKKMLRYIFVFEVLCVFISFYLAISIELEVYILVILLISTVCMGVVPIIGLGIIYWLTNILKNNNNYKGYYREVDDMYPPAMLSYLVDDYIEKKEDILATILNLSIKKYLNIEKSGDSLRLTVINQDYRNLFYHENYIIEALERNLKIDFKKFYDCVIYDCERNKLIYSKKSPLIKLAMTIRAILAGIGVVGLGIGMQIEAPNLILFSSIFAILAYVGKFAIKTHDKSSKGFEFAVKAKMLKNYLRDYTLVKEKDYDYIEIIDKYIPYALSLGEANKIEDLHIQGNKLMKDIVKDTNLMDEFINGY